MTVMHMTKNVGKPYEGKLHVRFDEGELKVKQRPAKESLLEISPLLYRSVVSVRLFFGHGTWLDWKSSRQVLRYLGNGG